MSAGTLAEKAVAEFDATGVIPQMGQRVLAGVGPGSVHAFPDGSVAAHWDDGAFLVASLEEGRA